MSNLVNTSTFLNLTSTLNVLGNTSTSASIDATTVISTQSIGSNSNPQSVMRSKSSAQVVGNSLTDTSLNPYTRQRIVALRSHGLRPGATVNVFCDGINQSNNCAPGIVNPNNAIDTSDHSSDHNAVVRTAAWGTPIVVDSGGNINAHFRIPASTYRTGIHTIEFADVVDINSQSANVTTYAMCQITTGPLSVTKQTGTLTTVNPSVSPVMTTYTPRISTPVVANNTATPANPSVGINTCDPFAQVFTVTTPNGEAGIHATSVDIYFYATPNTTNNGISLYICQVSNGVPDMTQIIPFSTVHLPLANVVASNVANNSAYTRFTFDSLVFLNADTDYAYVLVPDGDDPDYVIYHAQYGDTDAITGNQVFSQPGIGQCFYGGSGPTWTPINSEVSMFNLNRANFTATSGVVVHQNDPHEYIYMNYGLSFTSLDSQILPGDVVFGVNVYVTAANGATYTQSSNTVTVSNAANHQFSIGDTITINVVTGSTTSITTTVTTVINSSAFTYVSNSSGSYSGGATIFRSANNPVGCNTAQTGELSFHDKTDNVAHCKKSTGQFSNCNVIQFHRFSNNQSQTPNTSTLVCTANVYGLYNPLMNACMPQYSVVSSSGCSTKHQIQRTSNNYNSVSTDTSNPVTLATGIETQFTDNNCVIVSASNQNNYMSSNSSVTVQTVLTSDSPLLSPVIDTVQASLVVIENQIDPISSNYNEFGTSGPAQSKYISQVVTLASGQDSQDLQIYLDAYRPPNTDIQVWVRYLNAEDPDVITNKTWAPMRNTGINMFSSPTDQTDIHEFGFVTCSYYPMLTLTGTMACPASNVVTGFNTQFQSQLQTGWYLSSISNSTVSEITSQIVSIANNTSLTLATPLLINHANDAVFLATPSTTPWLSATSSTPTNGTVTCTTTNNTIVGVGTSFNTQFSLGSIIGINGDKQTVVSIANSTVLTVGAPWSSNASGVVANNITLGGLSYLNSSNMLYTTFVQFQIKVILQSDNPHNPPILHNLRAIALQL